MVGEPLSISNPGRQVIKTELVTLDQNPPVLNTLHEVFNETGGVVLHSLNIVQTNTPTNAAEVDVLITVDGRTILFDSSVVNVLNDSTTYGFSMGIDNATTTTETDRADLNANLRPIYMIDGTAPERGFPLKGDSIKVEIRQTSAIDAGARIIVQALIEKTVVY